MISRSHWTGVLTLAFITLLSIVLVATSDSSDAAAASATKTPTPTATATGTLPLRFRYRYYVDASLLIAETAKETKLTLAIVRRNLRQGLTLADIATANKCDTQKIILAVTEREQTATDRLTKFKLLSKKKGDTYLAGLQTFLTDIMNFRFYHPFTRSNSTNAVTSTQVATATH